MCTRDIALVYRLSNHAGALAFIMKSNFEKEERWGARGERKRSLERDRG